jgi:hypothetical protein
MRRTRDSPKEILLEMLKTFKALKNLTVATYITLAYDIGDTIEYVSGSLIREMGKEES